MTRLALQPMDSNRLAECALPMACYICGAPNTTLAEFCHCCAAPMALAHQAEGHHARPQMVAVMGASGAGKTVFLGMLMDMLSQEHTPLHLLARGAFSIGLQQTTVSALARCEFPEKTSNDPDRWNWVHCELVDEERPRHALPLELIMPDMAGEAVLEEVDHPHTYHVVRALLQKSAGAMVLIDAVELLGGNHDQGYFTMKLLSYLSEIEDEAGQGWSNRPIALVLTKTDQAEQCRTDPTAFVRTHAPGMWQHCQQRFRNHRVFAASVVGCCAWRQSRGEGRRRMPLRVEPHGIVEPFQWLLGRLTPKRK